MPWNNQLEGLGLMPWDGQLELTRCASREVSSRGSHPGVPACLKGHLEGLLPRSARGAVNLMPWNGRFVCSHPDAQGRSAGGAPSRIFSRCSVEPASAHLECLHEARGAPTHVYQRAWSRGSPRRATSRAWLLGLPRRVAMWRLVLIRLDNVSLGVIKGTAPWRHYLPKGAPALFGS